MHNVFMQKNEEIVKVLESIGLTKNEISVYLDLIKVGNSSALDISRRTDLHKSTIYDTLDKLIEKGFVLISHEENRKTFLPLEPKDLLNYHKLTEINLKKIIPELDKIYTKKFEERKVSVMEGIKSMKNMILHLLDDKSEILLYGMPKEVKEMLGPFLKEFHDKRIKRKIPFKGIYNQDAINRIRELNSLQLTEARYFPSTYNSSISTMICQNKVILQYWDMPAYAIIIENEAIAKSYKNYFNILWNEAFTSNNIDTQS